MIKRIFKDISEEQLDDAYQQNLLLRLGLAKGSDWDELLKSERILIISEAGSGKTYECRRQSERLWEAGEPAFFIELSSLAKNKFEDLLDHDELARFNSWLDW